MPSKELPLRFYHTVLYLRAKEKNDSQCLHFLPNYTNKTNELLFYKIRGLVKPESPNKISLQVCGHSSGWCHAFSFLSSFKFLTARKDFHPGAGLGYKAFPYKKQFMWGHNLSKRHSLYFWYMFCRDLLVQSMECWKSGNEKHSLRDALVAAVS